MGIEQQFTITYTPQQNGMSERKNRTIMEMARCLMFEKGLPMKFWAEAVNTSVYLVNRLPTNALEEKTSFEAWYGFKSSISNLRIFDSVCHIHVPDVKRGKLDEKSEIGVLFGYSSNAEGYRIYMPHNNKVTLHRDVKVDEQAS